MPLPVILRRKYDRTTDMITGSFSNFLIDGAGSTTAGAPATCGATVPYDRD